MLWDMSESVVALELRLLIMRWPDDAPRGAVSRFCAQQGISRSWFYSLRERYRREGTVSSVMPRSRAPKSSPQRITEQVADRACEIRKELASDGLDNGPVSVRAELAKRGVGPLPARSSLARLFTARGMVTPAPRANARARRTGPTSTNCRT